MPHQRMLESRWWVLVLSGLLGACAGVPGRGAPGRYEQSFDSATNSCRQRPELCARMAGEETVVPQAAQRLAEAGASVAAVGMALNADLKTRIEQALKECAEHARLQVLLDQRKGRLPRGMSATSPCPARVT
ncbi:MAG: hypothetical protein ACXU86_01690 [Archangium sp.]